MINLLVAEKLVINWLNEVNAVDLIYSDFSKAFDSLNHQLVRQLPNCNKLG